MAIPRSPYARQYAQPSQPQPTPSPTPSEPSLPYGGMNVIQEGYDALARESKEIERNSVIEGIKSGMTEDQARAYARQSVDLYKNKQKLEVQKKFVDLEAQRQNLETERQKSTQQRDLMKFISGIPRDTQNYRDYPRKLREYGMQNPTLLNHPDKDVRKMASDAMEDLRKEHEGYVEYMQRELNKYKLPGLPEEAMKEDGDFDPFKLSEIGVKHYSEWEKAEQQKELDKLKQEKQIESDIIEKRGKALIEKRAEEQSNAMMKALEDGKTPPETQTQEQGSSPLPDEPKEDTGIDWSKYHQ